MIYADIKPGQLLKLTKDAWIIGNWSSGSGTDTLIAANSIFVVEHVTETWATIRCGSTLSTVYPTSNNKYCWTAEMFEVI